MQGQRKPRNLSLAEKQCECVQELTSLTVNANTISRFPETLTWSVGCAMARFV
jgi:hypothetical protein